MRGEPKGKSESDVPVYLRGNRMQGKGRGRPHHRGQPATSPGTSPSTSPPLKETPIESRGATAATLLEHPVAWPPEGWNLDPFVTAVSTMMAVGSSSAMGMTLSENAGEINVLVKTANRLAKKRLWADASRALDAAIEVVKRAGRMSDATEEDIDFWVSPFVNNLRILDEQGTKCKAEACDARHQCSEPASRQSPSVPSALAGVRKAKEVVTKTAANAERAISHQHPQVVKDSNDIDPFLQHALNLSLMDSESQDHIDFENEEARQLSIALERSMKSFAEERNDMS